MFVSANYLVQLATVIPAQARGESARVALLAQTPHSMFWDFDAAGYVLMGIAMLIAIPALGSDGAYKRVRYAFAANALATPLICIVYFYPEYSERLLALGYVWGVTAPLAMLMLAMMFRKLYNADRARL